MKMEISNNDDVNFTTLCNVVLTSENEKVVTMNFHAKMKIMRIAHHWTKTR